MNTPKCCARIWNDQWLKYRTCSRNAKVDRDGKHYCGMHDPVYQAKAREEREARWQAEMDERARLHRLHSAAPDLLEALEEAVAYPTTGNWYEKAAAAIAKAKGGER